MLGSRPRAQATVDASFGTDEATFKVDQRLGGCIKLRIPLRIFLMFSSAYEPEEAS